MRLLYFLWCEYVRICNVSQEEEEEEEEEEEQQQQLLN